ncbi:MAG: hypothetical protein Kow00121_13030 [Elainellaceae cyanobacterium]
MAWQQAAELYAQQEDRLHQAMALTYLSLAFQQQAGWSEAEEAIEASLSLLAEESASSERHSIYAQALNAYGRLQLMLGQAETALETWQQATEIYEQIGDATGAMGSLMNQAQAMGELGFYRRSCQTLLQATAVNATCDFADESDFDALLQTLTAHPDRQLQILGLQSVGNLLRAVGSLDRSYAMLQQSLEIAQQQSTPQVRTAILLDLAETERSLYNQTKNQIDALNSDAIMQVREQAEVALQHYQQVVEQTMAIAAEYPISAATLTQLQAKIQQLGLRIDLQQWLQANQQSSALEQQQIQQQIQELFASPLLELPATRNVVYAQLNFVQHLLHLQSDDDPNTFWTDTALQYATTALQNAETLQDDRSQSYALGTIGQIYEQVNDWTQAQRFTQSALNQAQGDQAEDIAYRWQWQLGRIYAKQGQTSTAIDYYELAFNSLQSLRRDLVGLNSEVQFSFREDIEPVYQQLVDLLLRAEVRDQPQLRQARAVMDGLQVAEVENFLQQACSDTELAVIDQVIDQVNQQTDVTTAFIYTIILDDRLEVILKLPQSDQLQSHTVALSQTEVERTLTELQRSLQQKLPSRLPEMQQYAKQVYDWLVAPFAATLAQSQVNTLVFVLDGALRNIPMAALYDGEAYLIQSYAVATSPGLELFTPSPLEQSTLEALVAGATTSLPELGLPGLPNVEAEVNFIQTALPTTNVLLNQEFTSEALSRNIRSQAVPIVHIATHGQFSSRSEDTFLVTGDGDRLNINQLGELLSSREQLQPTPIELLFLSACQTVAGDKRAALGMAGVAVRSGARSTIASLWYADDEASAELVGQFYQFLTDPTVSSKAEALQLAQQALLNNPRFALPVYWSLYVLLGNWL